MIVFNLNIAHCFSLLLYDYHFLLLFFIIIKIFTIFYHYYIIILIGSLIELWFWWDLCFDAQDELDHPGSSKLFLKYFFAQMLFFMLLFITISNKNLLLFFPSWKFADMNPAIFPSGVSPTTFIRDSWILYCRIRTYVDFFTWFIQVSKTAAREYELSPTFGISRTI